MPNPLTAPLASPLLPPILAPGDPGLVQFAAQSGGSDVPTNATLTADGAFRTDAAGNYLIWSE